MDIQFEQKTIKCLHTILQQTAIREETQELRLPDQLPDVGRIMGCYGQYVVRGKEWRSNGMSVSGGIMVWVLYIPEGSATPVSLESWIPYQHKWDFPESQRDGFICVQPSILAMDARSVSARKIIVRATVGLMAKAQNMAHENYYVPDAPDEDIQLLKHTYPMELPMEFGEKVLTIEETIPLGDSHPNVEQILCFELSPVIEEHKVMVTRLVYKGKGNLHLLYLSDGKVHSWDGQVSFSQYADLDREYTNHSSARIQPVMTNLEVDYLDGALAVKASAAVQFTIFDRFMMEVVEDAYSTKRSVETSKKSWAMPVQLQSITQNMELQQSISEPVGQVVDIHSFLQEPLISRSDTTVLDVEGDMNVLYYDMEGELQGYSAKAHSSMPMMTDDDAFLCANVRLESPGSWKASGEGLTVMQQVVATLDFTSKNGPEMVYELNVGEQQEGNPDRPSIIIMRCKDQVLWDIAKESGSTVDAIREVNHLDGDPEPGQLLLIPVC